MHFDECLMTFFFVSLVFIDYYLHNFTAYLQLVIALKTISNLVDNKVVLREHKTLYFFVEQIELVKYN